MMMLTHYDWLKGDGLTDMGRNLSCFSEVL